MRRYLAYGKQAIVTPGENDSVKNDKGRNHKVHQDRLQDAEPKPPDHYREGCKHQSDFKSERVQNPAEEAAIGWYSTRPDIKLIECPVVEQVEQHRLQRQHDRQQAKIQNLFLQKKGTDWCQHGNQKKLKKAGISEAVLSGSDGNRCVHGAVLLRVSY
jgi:hypothetical protein